MHFGFSFVGLVFLILLTVPNLIWTRNRPEGYDRSAANENRFLLFLERTGEVLVTVLVLIFREHDPRGFSPWLLWLIASLFLMILYEAFWIRYFRSGKTMRDFYGDFLGIPVAGASLPVAAVLCIAVYGGDPFLLAAGIVLGIGHIGIHLGHRRETFGTEDAPAGYTFVALRERPDLENEASRWFHEKWGVPEETYRDCIGRYLSGKTEYGWYCCLTEGRIVGGLGIVENDFHERTDLSPNLCAVYTEKEHRGRGICGRLLGLAVEDMRSKGISPLYLLTDLEGFYERYGWEFCCMVRGNGEPAPSRMYLHR